MLETVDTKPIEKPRYSVPEPDVRKYEYVLINEDKGIPCALIVCCDESGVKFYIDARTKKVVVRYQQYATEVNLPINRQEPRLTLLGAITGSSSCNIRSIKTKFISFCTNHQSYISNFLSIFYANITSEWFNNKNWYNNINIP